ncbi:MAG: hypothetical protein R3A79_10785 [Nannocystaceae bacterium]
MIRRGVRRGAARGRVEPRGAALALCVALASACAGDPAERSPPQAVAWASAALDLELEPAEDGAADLRWRPPSACAQVYRITVEEDYPESLERAMKVRAERSVSTLALAVDPYVGRQPGSDGAAPRLAADGLWRGRSLFFGPRTKDREIIRELALSGSRIGPGAPDAACYERTWDPVEDALALGWPALPGRLTAIGERWRGARVESRCNRSACAAPESGEGGAEARDLTCATMAWRETLEGIYTATDGDGEAERVAAIAGFWSDGHPTDLGIWSERTSLVAVDSGRLIASEITIHHNRYKVTRSLRIEAVDACAGGTVALGGAASEPPPGAAGAEPGAAGDLARALAGLDARKPS